MVLKQGLMKSLNNKKRDSLLKEFDEEISNALVEKKEILTPAHFVFELKYNDPRGLDTEQKK